MCDFKSFRGYIKKKLKQAKLTFSSMYLFNPVYPIVFQQVIDTKNWSFLVFLFGFFCGLLVLRYQSLVYVLHWPTHLSAD